MLKTFLCEFIFKFIIIIIACVASHSRNRISKESSRLLLKKQTRKKALGKSYRISYLFSNKKQQQQHEKTL